MTSAAPARALWRPTAADILTGLREDYEIGPDSHGWALLTEVPLTAPGGTPRRIDALLVDAGAPAAGRRWERLAVEVKISIADYRNETDAKRAPAEAVAHRCLYAAPAGIIDPATLPPGWGLIELAPGHWPTGRRGRWAATPAERTPTYDLPELIATIAGKASRALERIRAAAEHTTGPDAAARAAALTGRIVELEAALASARCATARERERAAVLLARYLANDPQTCADCTAPIRPAWGREPWAHLDARAERACLAARAQARATAKTAATGAAYLATPSAAPRVEAAAERAERATDGWSRALA